MGTRLDRGPGAGRKPARPVVAGPVADSATPAIDAELGWYARYHQLQNQYDQLREQGLSLPPGDEAERQHLHARLLEESDTLKPTPPKLTPEEVWFRAGVEPPTTLPTNPSTVQYTPGLEPPTPGPIGHPEVLFTTDLAPPDPSLSIPVTPSRKL
ncbi:MAG: hypothetical protein JWO38_3202 [Gemmataceae bacterium]|nr:hypothetical protein [Gemmataceae bacterium]